MTRTETKRIVTASDFARYCGCNLKTIHNWTNKYLIPHWRTPGKHLRFDAEVIVAFLLEYKYPVPEELTKP